MKSRGGLSEWAFMIVVVMLCVILAALQYNWTGQISRAESSLLQTSLNEGLHELCQGFDAELSESRRALTPDASEIEARGLEAAHVERFDAWKASGARPIYKRIGVAIPKGNELELYQVGAGAKKDSASSWPERWSILRENLQNKLPPNYSAPFKDPAGALIEF